MDNYQRLIAEAACGVIDIIQTLAIAAVFYAGYIFGKDSKKKGTQE